MIPRLIPLFGTTLLTPLKSTYKFLYMSTKTIAVDSSVYERLAGEKREGESFSRAIDRLLEEVGAAHTGRDILRSLEDIPALDDQDSEVMLAVIRENRESEMWVEHDLR